MMSSWRLITIRKPFCADVANSLSIAFFVSSVSIFISKSEVAFFTTPNSR